ncbi:MAG: hypothetical protein SPL22_03045 [Treponema sp.]|uniref:hypothetical protein n=1 Tax=Treponema sp. TaxID=166 RepID=UPI002A9156A8|nr:hypothetical protein [Treponema sp.]MDY6396683.1 hypothetical protein [Treponema sp.]
MEKVYLKSFVFCRIFFAKNIDTHKYACIMLRASGFGLRASGFGLRASGFGLRASGFGL